MQALAGADLGGAGDRTAWPAGPQQVNRGQSRLQLAPHHRGEVVHLAVALQPYQLGHLDRSWLAHPAQVVAQ